MQKLMKPLNKIENNIIEQSDKKSHKSIKQN